MPANMEWLNQNQHRSYPFQEDADLYDGGGAGVRIPDSMLVDAVITIAGAEDAAVTLTRLAQVGGYLSLEFSIAGSRLMSVSVDSNSHVKNTGYAVSGTGEFEDTRGRVVFGDLSNIREQIPDGLYTFSVPLEPCCVRPDIRGVRSLGIQPLGSTAIRCTGDVVLQEGANIALTYLPETNSIRIDAINGTGMEEDCSCDGSAELEPIRTIMGIAIDDVRIVGDGECVEVVVSGDTITIKDNCSKPCCGCAELEFIVTNQAILEATISRLEAFSAELGTNYRSFVSNLLAAVS